MSASMPEGLGDEEQATYRVIEAMVDAARPVMMELHPEHPAMATFGECSVEFRMTLCSALHSMLAPLAATLESEAKR